MLEIKQTTINHLDKISNLLCDNTLREIKAIKSVNDKFDVNSELLNQFNESFISYTALKDDVPVWVFGVVPSSKRDNMGVTWGITGKYQDLTLPESMHIVRISRKLFKKALDIFESIEGYILLDNEKLHRLLSLSGFRFDDNPVKIGDTMFHRMYLERAC